MSSVVEFKDVRKKYENYRVLNGFTSSFPKGKVTGVLGENGAGKSTLLKMIAGLTCWDSGQVSVFGQPPSWTLNHQIAYLGDRSKWYPHHTVHEAIQFAASVYPDFCIQKATEYAHFMELHMDANVNTLSKGHEARLQLLICLARKVSLYLLDEPFSGIDLLSREKIVTLLIDLMSEREQSIVISTHNIEEIEGLFEYVVFIKDGMCIAEHKVEDLRNKTGSVQDEYRRLYR